ncbi:DUF433 domain-containing protein [Rhizobium rhizogenes]|uniref:DUF433 domain-containing protein n=1 Tax=Rhizobium rhizogenes NBRC 13257 TaxID=1220581 RepID=A0AA87QFS7_RHIRH|nr:DUF433 domain-containing protein [Rhizobium rhizogenes]NTG71444.1 DUF433 domain-containing protein [Rhizobium rhizogenes]NTG91092.1 DUF433 domain-containing protein [Rhizobium rhizogenes]GAJ96059.1 hypothetical protein RRH01S_16_00090 [Rhizobium rhizogenes NBRC 13257]
MRLEAQMLKTTEAAIVANVDVHNVNKLIDENILPTDLFVQNQIRRVSPGGCVAINFYVHTAGILEAVARQRAIKDLTPRLRDLWVANVDPVRDRDWDVTNKFVTIDFHAFLVDTFTRFHELDAARAAVVSDPEILGGKPVLKGTRIPVYTIAAMLAANTPEDEILEDYPSLDLVKLKLAAVYAKANPPRGRPTHLKLREGSKLSLRKSFPNEKAQ